MKYSLGYMKIMLIIILIIVGINRVLKMEFKFNGFHADFYYIRIVLMRFSLDIYALLRGAFVMWISNFYCDSELFSDRVFEVIILNQYVLLRGAFFGLKLLTYLGDLYYFRIVYMRFLFDILRLTSGGVLWFESLTFICDSELFSDSVFEVIILNQYALLRGAFLVWISYFYLWPWTIFG